MKLLGTVLIVLVEGTLGAKANAGDVQAGISISDGGIKGFYLAIGETYKVPEKEVVIVRERKIPDDQLPVVFFIATHARVAPSLVVDFRLASHTWFEVAQHFGVGPDAFYVDFASEPGPPYGKAWGYYKKHPRKDWHRIVLADDDIVNLVNLRMITTRYHCCPDEVVKLRAGKRGFVAVHTEIERGHGNKVQKTKVVAVKGEKGKKGKKHDKD
jgi:hypothetical protein